MRLHVAAKLMPAAGHPASADFWLVEQRDDRSVMVVLGDAGGPGGQAPLRAQEVRSLFQAAAADRHDPGDLLEIVNRELVQRTLVASALAVVSGPAGGNVRWASAGHPPPRRLDTGQPLPSRWSASSLGVGARCGARTSRVPSGAIDAGLLLYTDGVLDATGPHGVRFGDARLERALRELASRRECSTLGELMRIVCHFAAHALPDDTGALVVRRA